jgi:hypothetical protein
MSIRTLTRRIANGAAEIQRRAREAQNWGDRGEPIVPADRAVLRELLGQIRDDCLTLARQASEARDEVKP